jgi:hypothetical protein
MTLSEIFDLIRPEVERSYWEAWLAEGFEPRDRQAPPPGVTELYWQQAKDRCWEHAEARQAALYAEHGVDSHPEMIFARQAKTASERPF